MSRYGEPLSTAEYMALLMYARKGDQRDAANELDISVQTIKNQLNLAYAKLGVRSNIAAFRAMGWLLVPGDQLRAPASVAASSARASGHRATPAPSIQRVG